MPYKWFAVIVILLLFNSLGYTEEKIVRIATLGNYAPFCMAEKNARINQTIPVGKDAVAFTGSSWDILRESFHETGYTIQLFICPWIRAMHYVREGKVDILFPTGKNVERQKIFRYSRESVARADFLVYVKADNPIDWKGLASLNGLYIGVMRGYNYGDKWKANTGINKYKVSTISQGFKMLDMNRLNGILGYEVSWDFFLKQNNREKMYRKLPVFDSTAEYIVALQDNSEGVRFLNDFDTGKKRLKENGMLDRINRKWFNPR